METPTEGKRRDCSRTIAPAVAVGAIPSWCRTPTWHRMFVLIGVLVCVLRAELESALLCASTWHFHLGCKHVAAFGMAHEQESREREEQKERWRKEVGREERGGGGRFAPQTRLLPDRSLAG